MEDQQPPEPWGGEPELTSHADDAGPQCRAEATPAAPAEAEAQLVGNNDYTRLLASQTVSGLGDWMATTAFMALALDLSGSPTAVAGVLVVRLLPGVLAGPIAARVGTGWSTRRTMLAMDAVRAATVAVVPLVDQLWWIYAGAVALEVAGLVFLPARDASVPRLVGEHRLPTANALLLGSSYGTLPVGAGAFAAVAAFGAEWIPMQDRYSLVFWIDAATFVVSFGLIAGIHRLPGRSPARDEQAPGRLRDALSIDLVRQVLPAAIGASVGLGALFSVGIIFVQDVLHASSAAFGLLIVAFGAGALSGVVVVQRREGLPELGWARDGIRLAGASVAVISVLPTLAPAYLVAVLLGGGVAYGLVAGVSFLQASVEEAELPLAFAAFHISIRLALGIAALAAGVAADVVPDLELPLVGTVASPRLVLAAAGAVVLATTARVGSDGPTAPGHRS